MSFGVAGTYVGVSSQVANAQIINAKLGNDIAIGGSIFIPLFEITVIAGTWVLAVDGTQRFTAIWENSSSAQNDEFTFSAYIPAGTYTIKALTQRRTDNGILTISIDGTPVGTMETGGANLGNYIVTIPNVVNATAGIKTVSVKIATKSAGSSYQTDITSFEFVRTA
jgi:hypothetical protein